MSDSVEFREEDTDERGGEGGDDTVHIEEESNMSLEDAERSIPSLVVQLQAEIPCLDNVLELLQNLHQSANDILTKVPEMCLTSVHVKNTMDLMKDLMKRFSDLRYSFDTLKSCFIHQIRDTHVDPRRREEMVRLLDYKRRYMEQLVTAQESFSKTVDLVRLAVDTASIDVTEALRLRASQLSAGLAAGNMSAARRERSADESAAHESDESGSESDGSHSSSATGSSNASDIELRLSNAMGGEQLWNMMQRLLSMEAGALGDGNVLLGEDSRPIRDTEHVHQQMVVDEDKDLDEQVMQEQEFRQENLDGARAQGLNTSTSSHRLPADGGNRQNLQQSTNTTTPITVIQPPDFDLSLLNQQDLSSPSNPSSLDVQVYREKLARKIVEKEKSERQVEALRRTRDELLSRLQGRQPGGSDSPVGAGDNETTNKRSPGAPTVCASSSTPVSNSNVSPSSLAELRSRVAQLENMRSNLLQSMAQLEALESAAADVNILSAHSPRSAEGSPLRRQRLEGDGGVLGSGITSSNPVPDTLGELMRSLNGIRGALHLTESTNTDVSASSAHSNEDECNQDTITLLQERERILNELKEIREKKRLLQAIEANAERSLLADVVDNDDESGSQSFPRLSSARRNNQKYSRSSTNTTGQSSSFFGPPVSASLLTKPLNNATTTPVVAQVVVSGSTTPVSVAASTSAPFFSPKLSPQLLNGRPSANIVNGFGDGNHEMGVHGSTTNGGRDSVTFQEPVAKFIPNDELYENMRQARILREEERSRQDGNNVVLTGRGRHAANRWKGCGASNTTYSDITTQATWGGSSSGGAMTMSQLDEEMSGPHANGARDMNYRSNRTGRNRGTEDGGSTASRSISPSANAGGVRWCDDSQPPPVQGVVTENPYEKRIRELEEQLHMKEALCHELVAQLTQHSGIVSQPTLNVSQRSSSTNVSHSPIVGGILGLPSSLQSQQQRSQQEPMYSNAAVQQMATMCSLQTRFMFLQNQFQQLHQQMNLMLLSTSPAYPQPFLGAGPIPVPQSNLFTPVYPWQPAPMMPLSPMPWLFANSNGVNNGPALNGSGISQGANTISASSTPLNRDLPSSNLYPDWFQRLSGGQ